MDCLVVQTPAELSHLPMPCRLANPPGPKALCCTLDGGLSSVPPRSTQHLPWTVGCPLCLPLNPTLTLDGGLSSVPPAQPNTYLGRWAVLCASPLNPTLTLD
eukprot:351028-Chlamydomonas_euryale.AAC.4